MTTRDDYDALARPASRTRQADLRDLALRDALRTRTMPPQTPETSCSPGEALRRALAALSLSECSGSPETAAWILEALRGLAEDVGCLGLLREAGMDAEVSRMVEEG